MAAKRTIKRIRRAAPSTEKVTEITRVSRPVVARKTRIVGRTEPETLARAITEPVVWDVEVEAPVRVTRKKAAVPTTRVSKKRKGKRSS
jgi:hypothetical protein